MSNTIEITIQASNTIEIGLIESVGILEDWRIDLADEDYIQDNVQLLD